MSEDDLDMVIALNNLEASKREAMSDESMNKFLCEKVEKKCWHKADYSVSKTCADKRDGHPCKGCGIAVSHWKGAFSDVENPDYLHSSDDYLRLMQAAMKETWWADFRASFRQIKSKDGFKPWLYCHFDEIILDPSRGARALAEFLGYKEDGNE